MRWFCMGSLIVLSTTVAIAQEIPKHQAERIWKAVPEKARFIPKKPRRVLIFNTPAHLMDKDPHKGYCIPYGAYAFFALGKKTGSYEPIVSDDLSMFLPGQIEQFDAIVLNNTSGQWIVPTDADLEKWRKAGKNWSKDEAEQVLRKSFFDFIATGRGLVAIHFAIAGNRHWKEFGELIGATFTGHPWNEEVAVLVEEPNNPLLAAFAGRHHFRVADEIYQFGAPYDRSKLRVLLSLDTSRTNMGVPWISDERMIDNDFALAWVKSYGKGRIFYSAFGHRTEIFWNPLILQFFLDGIQFATGDLDAPTEPRQDKPIHRAPGPTPPKVREEKMLKRKVPVPTPEHERLIEEAAPSEPLVKIAKPYRLLVWGHTWAHDPNAFAEKALEILGKKTKAFQVVISDDPRLLLSDRIRQFDAIVMNNIHEKEPFLPEDFAQLDEEQQRAARQFDQAVKASILEYVRKGGGIVGIHAATAAFQDWAEYGEMIGGYYADHILQDVVIKVEDKEHPVNACFDGKSWRIRDEIYIFREPYSRKNVHVLLSLDLSQMPDPKKRPDGDYPVSWVKRYGEGRVFYTVLGHCVETYWNPMFLRHLLSGILYACGAYEKAGILGK